MNRPMEILLVEDNPGDILLTSKMLGYFKSPFRLSVARDGVEATEFLRKTGNFQTVPTPDLIFLDLNLPRKDGRELLKEIKGDNSLGMIPVIVLTTSSAESDVRVCYQLHANCVLRKPSNLESMRAMMVAIEGFWLELALLPPSA